MNAEMKSDCPIIEIPAPISELSLFLDFDGTLVEIAETPDLIEVPTDLPDLLHAAAHRLDGRLLIVSGRTISDIDRYLGDPFLSVSGSHGMELRLDGATSEIASEAAAMAEIESEAQSVSETLPGLLVERKRYGVALHYRQAPDLADRVRIVAETIAKRHGFALKLGKMVCEILPAASDKGRAVLDIMGSSPFSGTVGLFIGDDITDEDGFRAVQKLGGLGVIVGDRQETAARARLPDIGAVHTLLESFAEGTT